MIYTTVTSYLVDTLITVITQIVNAHKVKKKWLRYGY